VSISKNRDDLNDKSETRSEMKSPKTTCKPRVFAILTATLFILNIALFLTCSVYSSEAFSKETFIVNLKASKGDTLSGLLKSENLSPKEINNAIYAVKKRFNPRKLYVGQKISLILSLENNEKPKLNYIVIYLRNGNVVEVRRKEGNKLNTVRLKSPSFTWPAPTPVSNPRLKIITEDDLEKPEPKINAQTGIIDESKILINSNIKNNEQLPKNDNTSTITLRARPGDTIAAIIEGTGVSPKERDKAVNALRRVFNPRRLRVGQEVTIWINKNANKVSLLGAGIRLRNSDFIQIQKGKGSTFSATRVKNLVATLPGFTLDEAVSKNQSHANDNLKTSNISASENLKIDSKPVKPQNKSAEDVNNVLSISETIIAGSFTTKKISRLKSLFVYQNHKERIEDKSSELNKTNSIQVSIRKGDTLFNALKRATLTNSQAENLITAFKKVYDPRRLQVGQKILIKYSQLDKDNNKEKIITSLEMDIDHKRQLVVSKNHSGYRAQEIQKILTSTLSYTQGIIESSLYLTAKSSGLPNEVLMEMVHIFGFAVDFQRDIQPGDHFDVLFETLTDDQKKIVGYGSVINTSLTLSGKKTDLYRFEVSNGSADYFEEDGKSVRRALMRTPINGARLSSGYGMRRHPIQGYNKMHRGLDFAAPIGTPIMAAGDGTIDKIGHYGSYGKYIRIRHNSTYSTAYAHLSAYVKNLRRGSRVKQGQIIGYVGSTGRSTGPHLHYEILSGGKQVNPKKINLPSGKQLRNPDLKNFQRLVKKIKILSNEIKLTDITYLDPKK